MKHLKKVLLVLMLTVWEGKLQQGQPAQNQQNFQQQGNAQQQFQAQPPQQQQQINQPPPPQQFNQQPPQQQQLNQPPPPQQQQVQGQPQQQFNQPPPQFQQQVGQPAPPPGQQFVQQPQPGQGQRLAPGVPPPQQQQRFAPGVPPPQQQQQGQRSAPGVPQQQQARMQGQGQAVPPGMTQQQFAAQQQAERQRQVQQGQPIQLPPGVSPQQYAAMQAQQAGAAAQQGGAAAQQGGAVHLPPGVSPQQFAEMQAQQQQRSAAQPAFPPGHAVNIAPPTPPPPAGGGDTGNWLDDAPGIAMEYKVHVDAGKEDCYWQYVHPGATLYISYQVLKGGDGAIGVAVRNPAMKVVHPYAWKASSEYEESDIEQGGYYSVCLDNQFSKFSAKLVNLYITTFRYDEWEKFSDELKDMDVTVENFTSTLKTVDQRIQIMRQFQSMSRSVEARDFNIIQDNSSYVQKWSIAQILVVIICTVAQVNFVKSFFKDPKEMSGGGMKMRT